jgi:hypothetical protein
VRIEDDHIVWETNRDLAARRVAERRVPFGSRLEAFAGLANRNNDQLLGFAEKYGPLGLCRHGFAMGHRKRDFNARCYESTIGLEDLHVTRGPGDLRPFPRARESLEAWRRYIRRANGILAVADELYSEGRADKKHWSWLFDGIPTEETVAATNTLSTLIAARHTNPLAADLSTYPLSALLAASKGDSIAANPLIVVLAAQRRDTPAAQKQTLACTVNHWLDECGVAIAVDWSGSVVDFRLAPSHPLGFGPDVRQPSRDEASRPVEISGLAAIGAELLSAVMRRDSYVRCAACNRPYDPRKRRKGRKQPGRWPRAGENHYCPTCGKKASNKSNQRKYRAREKGEME